LSALDVGAGVGLVDRLVAGSFGELHGIDVSADAVERARRENPDVRYETYGGGRLPYEEGRFDLAFAVCVLHHVALRERPRLVAEMRRVTRPGGLVAVFEHNPLNPLTRLAVARCDFDEDVELMRAGVTARLARHAGLEIVERAFILVFPWRAAPLAFVERRLERLPVGAQYVVAARRAG